MYLNFKIIVFMLAFSMSFYSYAQINQTDEQGRKQGEWIKTYDDSDDIRYKGQFKDDEPVGKFVYYYPNKVVRSVIIHDEDSDRSEAYFYHLNKKLMAHGIYHGKKKDSVWTHFLPTGHYTFTETYKNGKLNGERITFYGPEAVDNVKTKLILRKANYKNGRLDGDFIEYFADGVVKAEGAYVNGAHEGVVLKNHPNGKTMIKERWKDGTKHGWWITYDESGKELGRIYFRQGVQLEDEELSRYLKKLEEEGVSPNK